MPCSEEKKKEKKKRNVQIKQQALVPGPGRVRLAQAANWAEFQDSRSFLRRGEKTDWFVWWVGCAGWSGCCGGWRDEAGIDLGM